MSIVQFENVSKIYRTGDHVLRALDRVSFTLDEGKFVVILGPSGAGKSTLLNLLGGLDSPSEGTITVAGEDMACGMCEAHISIRDMGHLVGDVPDDEESLARRAEGRYSGVLQD